MELNITIFIQAVVFFILFIFLSNVLFSPLNELFEERKLQTLGKKFEIKLIFKEIKKQDTYIKEQTSLTIKKAQNIYRRIQQENIIKKNYNFKVLQSESQVQYKNTVLKLNDEAIFVKKELSKVKNDLIATVFHKLYEN